MIHPAIMPKFLTKEVATDAVKMILPTLQFLLDKQLIATTNCHIAVFVQAVLDHGSEPYPHGMQHCDLHPAFLYAHSIGRQDWKEDLTHHARLKAIQLWHGRSNGSSVSPHQLLEGDTDQWGGVNMDGIIVVCAGFPPHIDRLVANNIASSCVCLAHSEWEKSKIK